MNKKGQGIVLLGLQWGDEGKGKIVDTLTANNISAVVRFQGGNNAGHTLVHGKRKTVLHLVPCGIMTEGVDCIMGTGMVVSLEALCRELVEIKEIGIKNVEDRIFISDMCTLILPSHIAVDNAKEVFMKNKAVGTTGKGIGPAYEDRAARRAVILKDIVDKDLFCEKVRELTTYHNFLLKNYYEVDTVDVEKSIEGLLVCREKVLKFITDVPNKLWKLREDGKSILFEGSQGVLLDINHGTYPYVTSSQISAGNAASGSGCGPKHLTKIVGIMKAYTTRVGNGDFPTELPSDDPNGDHLAKVGKELGATTGRKRRCGWLDLFSIKRSIELNSVDTVILNKIDVLDGLEKIKICIKHEYNDGKIVPIYKEYKGWTQKTRGVTKFKDLPKNAQIYVKAIKDYIQIPIDVISTGPDRKEVIMVKNFLGVML